MPRWLLEHHLDVLYEELAAAIPDRRVAYARLHRAARYLRDQRCRFISDAKLAAYGAAFDKLAGSEWSTRLPRTGSMLAAAVADEQAGIAQAVTSLEGWMTDASRFPPHWIAATHLTIRRARRHAAKAARPIALS